MPRNSVTDVLFEDLMIPREPLRLRSRTKWQSPAGLGQFDLSGIQWGDPTGAVQGAIQTAVDDGYQAFDSWVNSYLSGTTSTQKIDPVPVENQTTREVLAPVSAALQIPQVLASVPTLQALGTFLQNGWTKWQAFIDRVAQNYPSGAANSMARLQPYFSGLQARINSELSKQGATPAFIPGTNIPLPPQSIFSNMSGTTLLLLGVGGYFLLKGRR